MKTFKQFAAESYDDNRTGFAKKPRESDEGGSKFKAKSLMDRPHTVHIDNKAWKKFSNGHQAHAAVKTLVAKGKKATAVAHFKEESAVAVNAVGAGNVDGIGIGPRGEPGGRKAIMNKMMKRKPPNVDPKVPT